MNFKRISDRGLFYGSKNIFVIVKVFRVIGV